MCCILLILDTSILILYSRSSSMPVVAVVVVLWFAVPSAFEFELEARKPVYICKRLFILLNIVRFSSNLDGIFDGIAFLAPTPVSSFSQKGGLPFPTHCFNSDGQKIGKIVAQKITNVSICFEEHPFNIVYCLFNIVEWSTCMFLVLAWARVSEQPACLLGLNPCKLPAAACAGNPHT